MSTTEPTRSASHGSHPEPSESLGSHLRHSRERRGMSVPELARITRIPLASLEAIEADRFDELPGEVFVRGFLRAYAQAVRVLPAEILARYTSSRRVAFVTPLPMQTPLQAPREAQGRRFGVAIAFVLLLILLSLALSIVLKPRGRDMPSELSQSEMGEAGGGLSGHRPG
ncbi:MAG TPA: helix-turn-helix domain-containing protein [Polyangiaceae bacterium]|jgi:cytoskeletal protein RodZ|nr:helix-turn-helix domain-containing protein [Polyangiaceae bacterium]